MPFGRRKEKAPAGRIAVEGSSAGPVVDPDAAALRAMVLALGRDTEEHLIAAAVADDETYVQVVHTVDRRWVVEHQAGSKSAHAHAFVPDASVAAEIVLAWVAGDPVWHDLVDWQDGNH